MRMQQVYQYSLGERLPFTLGFEGLGSRSPKRPFNLFRQVKSQQRDEDGRFLICRGHHNVPLAGIEILEPFSGLKDRASCRLVEGPSLVLVWPATQSLPLSSPWASDWRSTAADTLFRPRLEASHSSGLRANSGYSVNLQQCTYQ